MSSLLKAGAELLRDMTARMKLRRETQPLQSVEDICDFAATRSAFVTQKKLYEYVKTRMGMSYPRHFEDDAFIDSMNIAKMHVYAAGLRDMAVFCVANATAQADIADDGRARFARTVFAHGLDANDDGAVVPQNRELWAGELETRMRGAVWRQTGANENHFFQSQKALVEWAPISDKLKKFDEEIVENSIRFAWQAVRQEFFSRIDTSAVSQSWKARDRE